MVRGAEKILSRGAYAANPALNKCVYFLIIDYKEDTVTNVATSHVVFAEIVFQNNYIRAQLKAANQPTPVPLLLFKYTFFGKNIF